MVQIYNNSKLLYLIKISKHTLHFKKRGSSRMKMSLDVQTKSLKFEYILVVYERTISLVRLSLILKKKKKREQRCQIIVYEEDKSLYSIRILYK